MSGDVWEKNTQHSKSLEDFGKYVNPKKVGTGGMGHIYLVENSEDENKYFILKKIVDSNNDHLVKRLGREFEILSKLNHHNIPKAWEKNKEKNFIVLDYIEGEDLQKFLENNRVTAKEIAIIVKDIASALSHVHQNKIIHRDIKSENIMIEQNTHKAWLIDFSVSKCLESDSLTQHDSSTQHKGNPGTKEYMSPEQKEGREVSFSTDIHSLGQVFEKLLNKKDRITNNTSLQELCSKMLEENPKKRPLINEVEKQLSEFIKKEEYREKMLKKMLKIIYPTVCLLLLLLIAMVFFPTEIPFEQSDAFKSCWREKNKVFDFTNSYWTKLSAKKQIDYAALYQRWYATKNNLPLEKIHQVGEIKIPFRLIPPGIIWVGSAKEEKQCNCERLDKVELKKPYYMSTFEINQQQWFKIIKSNPSRFQNMKAPVEQVSWNEVSKFCKITNTTLPTEIEWEYACRGGCTETYYFGNDKSMLSEYVWTNEQSTGEVGSKKPNSFGLYDMLGNVCEWCIDERLIYHKEWEGERKGIKGGFWASAETCRSAFRGREPIMKKDNFIGFRPILSIPKI